MRPHPCVHATLSPYATATAVDFFPNPKNFFFGGDAGGVRGAAGVVVAVLAVGYVLLGRSVVVCLVHAGGSFVTTPEKFGYVRLEGPGIWFH